MPILATLNTTDNGGPTPFAVVPVDDRRLEFWAIDGSDAVSWNGGEYIIRSGIQGLRLAPRDIVTGDVPGLPGTRLQEIRTLPRTVVLPFLVDASSGDYRDHLVQLDRLRGFIDFRSMDYAAAEGTMDLVAFADQSQRSLRCTYVDGMEGVDGIEDGSGAEWSTFDVKLLAVDPFWRGDEWSTPVVQLPSARPFLSNVSTAHPWGLSASVALGANMPVYVGGSVPSPACIELVGPATSTHITSPQGLDVTIGAITTGQTLIVDSGRRKKVLLNGVKAWNLLGDSPQWPPMNPGENTISVEVTGADANTRARVYGTSLWESAW